MNLCSLQNTYYYNTIHCESIMIACIVYVGFGKDSLVQMK